MIFRKENGKIILEFEDQTEFKYLVELSGMGNATYIYDRDTREEVKRRMQKITDDLERFCGQLRNF